MATKMVIEPDFQSSNSQEKEYPKKPTLAFHAAVAQPQGDEEPN